MLREEFEQLYGQEVSAADYDSLEALYMAPCANYQTKADFVAMVKKTGLKKCIQTGVLLRMEQGRRARRLAARFKKYGPHWFGEVYCDSPEPSHYAWNAY